MIGKTAISAFPAWLLEDRQMHMQGGGAHLSPWLAEWGGDVGVKFPMRLIWPITTKLGLVILRGRRPWQVTHRLVAQVPRPRVRGGPCVGLYKSCRVGYESKGTTSLRGLVIIWRERSNLSHPQRLTVSPPLIIFQYGEMYSVKCWFWALQLLR